MGQNLDQIPVSVVPCEDYQPETVRTSLEQVLAGIGGLDFVKPGMKIAIKLNLVSPMKAETAATTHPALAEALCKMLVERGAEVVMGDSPGGPFNAAYLRHVYQVTGIAQAAQNSGAKVNENFDAKEIEFPEAVEAKNFTGTAWLTEADAIINFCKLKTHGMMGMSAAVKNLFGTIPGTMKPEYHFRYPKETAFADMLVDLDEYWKPVLNIVDAVIGMEGNGPTAGTPRKIGLLLASKSPYNLDLICEKIIGLGREDVLTSERAWLRGLSAESAEAVPLVGEVDPYLISDFGLLEGKRSLQFGGDGLIGRLTRVLMGSLLLTKPKVKTDECIGCKKCFEICPAKAITMKNNIPVIDRDKCIHCFCCQEFCPKGAMKAHRTAIAKLITKG